MNIYCVKKNYKWACSNKLTFNITPISDFQIENICWELFLERIVQPTNFRDDEQRPKLWYDGTAFNHCIGDDTQPPYLEEDKQPPYLEMKQNPHNWKMIHNPHTWKMIHNPLTWKMIPNPHTWRWYTNAILGRWYTTSQTWKMIVQPPIL